MSTNLWLLVKMLSLNHKNSFEHVFYIFGSVSKQIYKLVYIYIFDPKRITVYIDEINKSVDYIIVYHK